MAILSAFAASFAAAQGASHAAGSKPNFVVFFADDLGWGDLASYGHPNIRTPHIDKLASEGMRFTSWYSGFHVCSPSRASMMTGRIPTRSGCVGTSWLGGVFGNEAVGGLPLNETTMADQAKAAGYATGMFGKWHLGQQDKFLPTSRGFDTYLGIPYSVDMGASAWGNKIGLPVPLIHDTTILEQPANYNILSQRYHDFATGFIDNATGAGKPFLLYAAFSHVHIPDFASPDFCHSSLRGLFGDALQEMDNLLGSIMAHLAKSTAADNTLVFFSSDNGPWTAKHLLGGSPGHLRDGKGTTYEGGIRVPGIAWWPGHVPMGVVSTEYVATYDIFATVSALAGVPLPGDRVVDGKDLSGVLFNNASTPHDCLFHYKGTGDFGSKKQGLWAVRCGAYKIHYVIVSLPAREVYMAPGVVQNPPLIYNVEHDPSELYNLSPKSDEYKAANATFAAAVAAHLKTLTPVPNQMAKGTDAKLAQCGCPNSTTTHPEYPRCTCNPENFKVDVCADTDETELWDHEVFYVRDAM
eukprot:Hpha_TRINITY_DN26113_c0_g1::TRINITY_DN26113_c0_g1_i1::g.155323::m.155323/K01134/ARSA; arylsulfatase A